MKSLQEAKWNFRSLQEKVTGLEAQIFKTKIELSSPRETFARRPELLTRANLIKILYILPKEKILEILI